MQISEIIIQNFRGFEERNFLFDTQFNVAIGNNTMGKSTLLNSLQVALGGYLQCLDIPSSKNYRRQYRAGEAFVRWNEEERSYTRNLTPTLITTTAKFSHISDSTKWTRVLLKNNTTSHNRRDVGQLMDTVDDLMRLKQDARVPMPIVASFGTERTVAQLRKGKKAQSRRTSREKAFLAALSEKVDFNGVIEWLHNYDKDLEYKKEFPGTKIAVFKAIETAIPYLKHVEYNSYYQELEAEVTVSQHAVGKILHSNMSDGLKAMLNLVSEIAFRCVVLNGFLEERAVTDTPGVVLIDELDMHLHPNWQMSVVDDLKAAFPSIQFVVTTHSPFIVQSLKKEELIILEEGVAVDSDPFRRSIEEIASNEMDVQDVPRSKAFLEMEEVAKKYYDLIAAGKTSENDAEVANLREQLNELEDKFSEDPAFVALLKSERKSADL
jgi:predicted ATP-binding protein involved in virulence